MDVQRLMIFGSTNTISALDRIYACCSKESRSFQCHLRSVNAVFSCMNIANTPIRNRLRVESLSALLFIKVKGPQPSHFEPVPYVTKWLQEGHHASQDALARPEKTVTNLSLHSRLCFDMYKHKLPVGNLALSSSLVGTVGRMSD